VSQGLATTFKVLTHTDNEAAVPALLSALDSPHQAVQEGALRAILNRRSRQGGREILRRLDGLSPRWKEIIGRYHGRLTGTLRDAIVGSDPHMAERGCRAAVWFREYDLIPALLNVIEGRSGASTDLAANTLLELVGVLYEELAASRDYTDRRDPQRVRERIVESLGASVKRFERHKRREVIEAFLLLAHRDDVVLQGILRDPHHAAFVATMDVLLHSGRGGVMRLLLGFLDDPRAPSSVLSAIARRSDLKFVRYLLRKIGHQPSAAAGQNLKRIESIPWLCAGSPLLEQLDDASQHGAVRLAMTCGISRLQAFSTIEHVLRHGNTGGRRAAAAALAEFQGAAANALALRALDDPDPQVQASTALQLRHRGVPGAMSRLLALVESPHAVVRRAVRESLAEFSFPRFLAGFDMLDEEVRRSTGLLVKRIDPETVPLLRVELKSKMRTRRLRGLAVAGIIDVVEPLEREIIHMLDDEDHLVRAGAAAALAHAGSEASRLALETALEDTSPKVRETAEESLRERCQFHRWREALSDPRD